jgi:hypothetical protein
VLAGLAALVAAIAVAATVYLTGFAGSSTATLTRGGLTKPTIGSVTTIGQPTPGRPGRRPVHTGGKPGDPTPSTSPPASSHPASHPQGKPTAPATKHPSSAPVSPSKSPPATATTPSVPFGVYQCGKASTVSGGSASAPVMILTACIRVYNGELEIEGQLTGAVAGHDKIELALESSTNGTLGDYNSPLCATSTCVYQLPVLTPGGHWYVVATVLGDEGPFTGAPSPTISYLGL